MLTMDMEFKFSVKDTDSDIIYHTSLHKNHLIFLLRKKKKKIQSLGIFHNIDIFIEMFSPVSVRDTILIQDQWQQKYEWGTIQYIKIQWTWSSFDNDHNTAYDMEFFRK